MTVGTFDGILDGVIDGLPVGEDVTLPVGEEVGVPVGSADDGALVTGAVVGLDGPFVGSIVGAEGLKVVG